MTKGLLRYDRFHSSLPPTLQSRSTPTVRISGYLFPIFLMLVGGCAHRQMPQGGRSLQTLAVSLPVIKLAKDEYIESVELAVCCGRIVAIQSLLDDWDLEVRWDSPDLVKISTLARHFPAGRKSVDAFAGFITVSELPGKDCFNAPGKRGMRVTATVVTDTASPDGTGPGPRKYEFSEREMVLKPLKSAR